MIMILKNGGWRQGLECVSPDRLSANIPYVITTIESDQIAYEIRAQCSKMRVEARKYGDLIRRKIVCDRLEQDRLFHVVDVLCH